MKKYFLHNGKENLGEFSVNQLFKMKLTKDNHLWCAGMDDWQTIYKVPEFSTYQFKKLPPEFKKSNKPDLKLTGMEPNVQPLERNTNVNVDYQSSSSGKKKDEKSFLDKLPIRWDTVVVLTIISYIPSLIIWTSYSESWGTLKHSSSKLQYEIDTHGWLKTIFNNNELRDQLSSYYGNVFFALIIFWAIMSLMFFKKK